MNYFSQTYVSENKLVANIINRSNKGGFIVQLIMLAASGFSGTYVLEDSEHELGPDVHVH